MNKIILLDVGGVLLPSPLKFWKDFEAEWHLKPGSISKIILSAEVDGLYQSLERGEITLPDFENLFTYFYNKKYKRHGQTTILPIFSALFQNNGNHNYVDAKVDKRWVTAIDALRASGAYVCIATNNFWCDRARLASTLPAAINDLHTDAVFESCRLGMRKPEDQFYKHLLSLINCNANSIIFIDDFGLNLKTAAQLGFTTVKHDGNIEATLGEVEKFIGVSLTQFASNTRPPSMAERFDESRLRAYLANRFPHPAEENGHQLIVRKFTHGQSNPTYHVSCCGRVQFVLRKKPSGALLLSAHQIDREYRVQKALRDIIPVPEVFDYVEGLLDTPFYLMEYCQGRIFTDPALPGLTAAERTQIYTQLCDLLLKLRRVDVATTSMSDFGAQGNYVKRNLRRFVNQYEANRLRTTNISKIENLIRWLESNITEMTDVKPCIVHGDFRLDNIIFVENEWHVAAVLDWEMSTLGDPMTDLATCLLCYYLPRCYSTVIQGLGDAELPEGIPSLTQFLHRYFSQLAKITPDTRYEEASRLTASGSLPAWWTFYVAFVLFRYAIILMGISSRLANGQASNPTAAASTHQLPAVFVELALKIIEDAQMNNSSPAATTNVFALTSNQMSAHARSIHRRVKEFIASKVLPIEGKLWKHSNSTDKWKIDSNIEKLKTEARSQGLWNLFLTHHLDPRKEFNGALLSTLEYGHICELMGQSTFAPEIFNCNAPDTGNMEVLIKYGTPAQRREYLQPLLDGRWRSCFAMTEPDVASSDATNIQGTIIRDGDVFVLNARKWFTSGALHPNCRVCIFMGRIWNNDTSRCMRSQHYRQSMILVDFHAPGIKVVRPLDALGMHDAPGGHAEVLFENVRVPAYNLLLGEGRGFEIAQGRLGPGRIHHCMRLVGHAERALTLMKKRTSQRIARGKPLKDFQNVRLAVAQSRIDIEQTRMLVLKAAYCIDEYGAKAAAADIAMIKIVAPQACARVIDRAIQHFGAAGLSSADWPLAAFATAARALRIADGPDVVHEETVARAEFQRSHI